MQQNRRVHYRVRLKEIHPSPAEGIYLPKESLRIMGIYGVILAFVLLLVGRISKKR